MINSSVQTYTKFFICKDNVSEKILKIFPREFSKCIYILHKAMDVSTKITIFAAYLLIKCRVAPGFP
jgi:hypothetical protein